MPVFVNNYYTYVSDFKCGPQQRIFLSNEELDLHLRLKGLAEPMKMIKKISSQAYLEVHYAFLYMYKNNVFIVQNVLNGELGRALYVAKHWLDIRINSGYMSPLLTANIPYISYMIENEVITCDDEEIDFSKPQVLSFDSCYAALLPLY